jgi:hypothetical protein
MKNKHLIIIGSVILLGLIYWFQKSTLSKDGSANFETAPFHEEALYRSAAGLNAAAPIQVDDTTRASTIQNIEYQVISDFRSLTGHVLNALPTIDKIRSSQSRQVDHHHISPKALSAALEIKKVGDALEKNPRLLRPLAVQFYHSCFENKMLLPSIVEFCRIKISEI